MKKLTVLLLVLALSAALLAGCTIPNQVEANVLPASQVEVQLEPQVKALTGGVLRLKINPEIALHYDENGKVTKLEGSNADGVKLLENFTGYEGKETSAVLEELVQRIGEAGYFVEEAEGRARKIVLELDPGSQVPHETFLEDMAIHVKTCVENKAWVGEREYDYPDPVTVPKTTEPVVTEPKATEPASAVPKTTKPASSGTGSTRCPVCYDDDCDDGKYCDDWDDRKENEREAENRKNGTPCKVCGEHDCDDGKYCDDWDERYERDDDDDDHRQGRHYDD